MTRHLETERLKLQNALDASRTQHDRNRLGQFATPPALARAIVRASRHYLPEVQHLDFLEPSFGTGAFYSALTSEYPSTPIDALGYEIDDAVIDAARQLWRGHNGLTLRRADFTEASPPEARRFNLLIGNPPYARHHHIDPAHKKHLQIKVEATTGLTISGLAGLHCYFVLLCDPWLAPSALCAWLLPGGFLDVNYGAALKSYLLDHGTLLRIHRFDPEDMQFSDALVTSVVVWFSKTPPAPDHRVLFTSGGDVERPSRTTSVARRDLSPKARWTRFFRPERASVDVPAEQRFGAFFTIRRGVATGANRVFIRPRAFFRAQSIPDTFLRPILPSPRHLTDDHIRAEPDGYPALPEPLALLCCDRDAAELKHTSPELWAYLEAAREAGIHDRYLCRHRTPWYRQERREPAPFLCTYMGRKSLKNKSIFRFILNRSDAIAANVYTLLYPRELLARRLVEEPALYEAIWERLQNLGDDALLREGRVYGGGLQKLEPKELQQLPVPWMRKLLG